MAPCCLHTIGHDFSLYLKSLAQKLTEKMRLHLFHGKLIISYFPIINFLIHSVIFLFDVI